MKTRPSTPPKLSMVTKTYRTSNHQEDRYYCDLCRGEMGEAEGIDLPDGRFIHKRHKVSVPVIPETSEFIGFGDKLKSFVINLF